MQELNRQLAAFRERLRETVGLSHEESLKVATHVAADIRFLSPDAKAEIVNASPVPISARLDELVAFQSWMDDVRSKRSDPATIRAQVIVQNYVCFVYLKDSCFEIVAKCADNRSVAARCASFLSTGTVRDFRNAFSHANWKYNAAFTGLECWILEDTRNRSSPLRRFDVSQSDLGFWQALARGVAYAIYLQL